MTSENRYGRIVAWTDGSDDAARATDWAARHAVARALPLHVLYIPRSARMAGIGRARSFAVRGFQPMDQSTSDMARVADDVQHLRAKYRGLLVSEHVVQDGYDRPKRELLNRDDILVTWPSGFLELAEQTELEDFAAARVPAPTVFVPDGEAAASNGQRVLLLTGDRFFPAAATFAFAAAADLGVAMDVVHLAAQAAAYGDDYWIDPGHAPYAAGPHLRTELAKLDARLPGVLGEFFTPRIRPWYTLRAMTRATQLAVLGVGAFSGVDVRAVYDLDTCPVAAVPERWYAPSAAKGRRM